MYIQSGELKIIPAWSKCKCCDDFLCNIHGVHAHECECPDIEEWDRIGIDPYSPCIIDLTSVKNKKFSIGTIPYLVIGIIKPDNA